MADSQGRALKLLAGRLPQLARLQQNALALSDPIRWGALGQLLKDDAALFQRVIDLIAEVLEVEMVSLMLLNEPDGTLRIAHAKGLERFVQREAVRAMGEGISGRVAKTDARLARVSVDLEARVRELQALRAQAARA